jgi:hypothetical protein
MARKIPIHSEKTPREYARMSALAVAMRAVVGDLEPRDVAQLEELALALRDDDGLSQAVADFMTVWGLSRWDPAALFAAGETLHRAVLLDVLPVPPGQERADIHG